MELRRREHWRRLNARHHLLAPLRLDLDKQNPSVSMLYKLKFILRFLFVYLAGS